MREERGWSTQLCGAPHSLVHQRRDVCRVEGGFPELARVEAHGKAMASLIVHEQGLSVLLDDPRIPMDNNRPERITRGWAIVR